uniref:PD-(D/E)XK nuclease family protein n=1 Tax=Symbiobacterium terraclitae TaxID=557451 RepID=UPI0035B511E5
ALGEGEDVVRLMSIHKSKGLEFPVVFVAGLGSKFARQDLSGDLLLERGLGFGPVLVDPEVRVKYPTLAYHAVRESTRLASLAEELRVLYVALTRPRERLVLVGSAASLRGRCQRWARAAAVAGWALPESLLLSADAYLDWVGPAVLRHAGGGSLRTLAGLSLDSVSGLDAEVLGDRSRWQVTIWDPEAQQRLLEVPDAGGEREELDWARIGAAEPLDRPLDEALGEALRARFAWRYPYEPVVRRFGKLSVTELKGHFDPDADAPGEPLVGSGEDERAQPAGSSLSSRPRFLQEERKGLSPTERGTVMHLVLQHLDLTRPLDAADVAAQVDGLVRRELLTAQQAAAVDTEAIASFFASPLGLRIRQRPDRVRRELSFTLAVPASEVYPDLPAAVACDDVVIVQGMIDLLLEEEDGYVLVDYKTDRREPEQAALRYGTQIRVYRRAVEEILGRPVKEAYLHFLASHRSLSV